MSGESRERLSVSVCVMSIVVLLLMSMPGMLVSSAGNGGWGVAMPIDPNEYDIGTCDSPSLAVNPSGDAMAVWRMYDGGNYHIYANRYNHGTGWESPIVIETLPIATNTSLQPPKVAMDPMGNAMAVFTVRDVSPAPLPDGRLYYHVYAVRYTAGAGWGQPLLIENAMRARSYVSDIAMDVKGNAMVVWTEDVYTTQYYTHVMAARWSYFSSDWQPAVALEQTDDLFSAQGPTVRFDATGNAIAVWYQLDGSYYKIWYNRYTYEGSWSSPANIIGSAASHCFNPSLAVAPNGKAICVWLSNDGTRTNVAANHYDSSASPPWSGQILIESIDQPATEAYVGVDSAGNAIASWLMSDGTKQSVYASRHVESDPWATSWQTPVKIESNNDWHAYAPKISVNGAGDGIVVWRLATSTGYNVWANRYVSGSGWGTEVRLETGIYNTGNPLIGMDASGNAIGVWEKYDSLYWDIFANIFTAPDVTAPTLTVNSPNDLATTSIPAVYVSGTTEPGAHLSVNGVLAAVSSGGAFGLDISLQEGANVLTITATDASGNARSVTRTVTFANPISALESELDAVRASLIAMINAVQANLTTNASALTTLEASLAQMQATVNGLRQELIATHAGLNSSDSMLSQLTTLQSQISSVWVSLNETKTLVSETQDDLDAKAESSAPMMWGIIAIVIAIVAAIGVSFMLMKRKPSG